MRFAEWYLYVVCFFLGQLSNQQQIENRTGQWLGATVNSAGVDGPIVVSAEIEKELESCFVDCETINGVLSKIFNIIW